MSFFLTAPRSLAQSPESEQPSSSFLPPDIEVSITNGAINDVQNTTGGCIALINKCCQDPAGNGKRLCTSLVSRRG